MPMLFVAALMMAQAPAAVQPAAVQTATAKKQKRPQVCEYIELTGSRSKRRVCRDASGNLDVGPGIRSGTYDPKASNQAPPDGGPSGSN